MRHVEAEMPVLGAMMLDPSVARRAVSELNSGQFLSAAHERLFGAMCRIVNKGAEVDGRSLAAELEVSEVGGSEYLVQVAESCPTARNYPWYREAMLKNWRMREVAKRASSAQAAVEAGDYESAMGYVNRFGQGLTEDSTFAFDVAEVVESLRRKGSAVTKGIPSGISKMDDGSHQGCALRCGRTVFLASESGVGKTYLGCQVVKHACEEGKRVLFGSYELDREEVVERLVRQLTGIRDWADACRFGLEKDWEAGLRRAELWDLTIYDDASRADESQTVEDFARFVRAEHEHRPVDLVVVDYLQLLETVKKISEERLVIKRCSRVMRAEAKRTGIPWFVLAQAEEPPKTREDSDPWPYIRGGKEPEKDAAAVYFLSESQGRYTLRCKKNRYHHAAVLEDGTVLPRRWSRTLWLHEPSMEFWPSQFEQERARYGT